MSGYSVLPAYTDYLGQEIRPGYMVSVAVSNGSMVQQYLAEVEEIREYTEHFTYPTSRTVREMKLVIRPKHVGSRWTHHEPTTKRVTIRADVCVRVRGEQGQMRTVLS